MLICALRECFPGEARCAITPESTQKLQKLGFTVAVEAGIGDAASLPDSLYEKAGARVVSDAQALLAEADIVLKVRLPLQRDGWHEADALREGSTLVCFVWPARSKEMIDRLAARKINLLAMDCVPRISRAQKLDALSSMANIAGYRAVIEAAHHFGSFFCGQITAAGKVAPAKVLVIGAGVAGLAALGAAKGLGAIVRSFDTRSSVKEQITSMGAEFLEVTIQEDGETAGGYAKEMSKAFIDAEMALFRAQAKEVDIVITTAQIPGRAAPKLWLADMVPLMRPGSVVIDLAAESGGNCELTEPGQVVVKHGVTIDGRTDLVSRLPGTASQLYAQNLVHFLTDLGGNDKFALNLEDDVVRGAIVLKAGELLWPAPEKPVSAAPAAKPAAATKAPAAAPAAPKKSSHGGGHGMPAPEPAGSAKSAVLTWLSVAAMIAAFVFLKPSNASEATKLLWEQLTVFVLACFVGWQVVWNVTAALHTPLMSVTNAISGIIIVGGLLHGKGDIQSPTLWLGLAAVFFASINIFGGFAVTRRMLRMFRR